MRVFEDWVVFVLFIDRWLYILVFDSVILLMISLFIVCRIRGFRGINLLFIKNIGIF